MTLLTRDLHAEGKPTANAHFGNAAAVLCGDVLMSQALDLLADKHPAAIPAAARTIRELSHSALWNKTSGTDVTPSGKIGKTSPNAKLEAYWVFAWPACTTPSTNKHVST